MHSPENIAALLLNIKAVSLNVKDPFRYTSGIISPIYCDNRLIISHPKERNTVIDAFLAFIKAQNLSFDFVAGTATAGIPHAAWIADRLNLPMVYVRSSSKKHGKQNQIEGTFEKGQTGLVVEDLISTAGSCIDAANALREAGAVVNDCVAIFTYALTSATVNINAAKLNVHTLSNFKTLLNVALQQNVINQSESDLALAWSEDPEHWGH